jgi:hypothetical protein
MGDHSSVGQTSTPPPRCSPSTRLPKKATSRVGNPLIGPIWLAMSPPPGPLGNARRPEIARQHRRWQPPGTVDLRLEPDSHRDRGAGGEPPSPELAQRQVEGPADAGGEAVELLDADPPRGDRRRRSRTGSPSRLGEPRCFVRGGIGRARRLGDAPIDAPGAGGPIAGGRPQQSVGCAGSDRRRRPTTVASSSSERASPSGTWVSTVRWTSSRRRWPSSVTSRRRTRRSVAA